VTSDHPRESPEGVIRLSSPGEYGSNVRIESHDDAALGVSRGVLVRPSPAKVVLGTDFGAAPSKSCDLVSFHPLHAFSARLPLEVDTIQDGDLSSSEGRTRKRAVARGARTPLTRGGAWPYLYGMDWRSRITIEPGKRSGKPCIRGLRITVSDVLEYLASGMTEDQILQDFPDLTRDDIRACLAFAADRERKFVSVPPA
jgi:uncharacterized protein (DUF433 family)